MIEPAIYSRLISDPTFAALVGGRLYPTRPTTDTAVPYAVHTITASSPVVANDGVTSLTQYVWQLDTYAVNVADVLAVMARAAALLNGASFGPIQRAILQDQSTTPIEYGYFGQATYGIWANESVEYEPDGTTPRIVIGDDSVSVQADGSTDAFIVGPDSIRLCLPLQNCDGSSFSGPQGPPGVNLIDDDTPTTLVGYLTADGTTVGAATTIPVTDITELGTLATQDGTFSGVSSGTNTGDQTITLSGDVSGSGTGAITTTFRPFVAADIPTAIMAGATATQTNGVAVGPSAQCNATVSQVGGTAVGYAANASATNATALGYQAVSSSQGVAVGTGANANAFTVAIGSGANANPASGGGTAIGYGCTMSQSSGVGIGYGGSIGTTSFVGSVGVGYQHSCSSTGQAAIGYQATAGGSATGAMAFGYQASATGARSVAIGYLATNSTAGRISYNGDSSDPSFTLRRLTGTTPTQRDVVGIAGTWSVTAEGSQMGRLSLNAYSVTTAQEAFRADAAVDQVRTSIGGAIVANKRLAVYCGTTVDAGVLVRQPANKTATVSNVSLTTNVATITTSSAHNFVVNDLVTITGLTTTALNVTLATITSVPSTTTFTFALVNADIASTADSGTATVAHSGKLFEAQSSSGTTVFSVTAGVIQTASAFAIGGTNSHGTLGGSATAVGNAAACAGSNAVAVGVNSSAASSSTVAIGSSATVTAGTGGIAIGLSATTNSGSTVAIGSSANASASGAVALGVSSAASTANAVALGNGATASSASGIAIGVSAQAITSTGTTIAIGASASSNTGRGIALGASCTSTGGVSIGYRAVDGGTSNFAVCPSTSGAAGATCNFLMQGQDSAQAVANSCNILAGWSSSTAGRVLGRLTLNAYDGTTSREFFRGEATSGGVKTGFNGSAAISKPTITGSRGGNAAVASLLTNLASYGLIVDGTTA